MREVLAEEGIDYAQLLEVLPGRRKRMRQGSTTAMMSPIVAVV